MNQPITDGLRIRSAARAIVLDPVDAVLLVRFEFPDGSRWALPGGGLDPGETHVQALQRELAEETGLLDAAIGEHVWSRLHVIPFINGRYDGQREQIYVVRLASRVEPAPQLSWEQLNAEYVFELRWWTLAEIASATEIHFVPDRLAELLGNLLSHRPAIHPIDVGE